MAGKLFQLGVDVNKTAYEVGSRVLWSGVCAETRRQEDVAYKKHDRQRRKRQDKS